MTDYYDVYFYRPEDYRNAEEAQAEGGLYKTPNTIDCLDTGNGTYDLIELIDTINDCTATPVKGAIKTEQGWMTLEEYYNRTFRNE